MIVQPKMGYTKTVFLTLLLGGLAQVSLQANTGTPIVLAGVFHLIFGNALIAIAEGLILARLFRIGMTRCFLTMAAANYASAWVGFYLLLQVKLKLDFHIYNGMQWLWFLAGSAFLLTILIEWPFVIWCVREKTRSLRRAFLANLAAQTASYALIFVFYNGASFTDLLRRTDAVSLKSMNVDGRAVVYFLGADSGDVYRMRLGGLPDLFLKGYEAHARSKLSISRSEADTNQWNLLLCFYSREIRNYMAVPLTNLAGIGPERTSAEEALFETMQGFGPAIRLGRTNRWEARASYFPMGGVIATNPASGKGYSLGMDSPLMSWLVRDMTQLPNDQVVFQLGKDQICLFDPNTMQLALIARGRGPAVVLEE